MADNEIAELHRRVNSALLAMITASGQLAQVLVDARIAQLRRAAERSAEQARQTRAQARARQQADAAVWQAAMRPTWWRDASAEDISRVWRAASTWHHVDPRAEAARQVVVDRLAERGVQVDPAADREPADVESLSDALDRSAVDEATEGQEAEGRGQADQQAVPSRQRMTVDEVRDRQERMAAEVRRAWPGALGERVIACEAWGALAYKLDQAQRDGHDVQQLLRGVPPFITRARTPAAFAFRSVEDRLEGRVDLGTVRKDKHGQVQPQQPGRTSDPARRVDLAGMEPHVAEAAKLVVETRFGSVAMLQRRMGLGFADAARVMTQLEQHGIVGPARDAGPREVLVKPEGLVPRTATADQPTSAGESTNEATSKAGRSAAGTATQAYPASTQDAVAEAAAKGPNRDATAARSRAAAQPTREQEQPGR